jgi:hypothetical protein
MSTFHFLIRKAKIRPPTQLEALSDKMANQVSVNLLSGITRFKKRISLEKIANAIETGSMGHVLKEIPWNDSFDDLYTSFKKIDKSFEVAAMISKEALPANLQKNLRMDLKNPAYKKFIDQRFAKFLQDLNEESQKRVQRAIQRSFSRAISPRKAASEIIDHIGLNDRQSQALINYQMGLEKQGIAPNKVELLASKYESKLLKQRSVMISRTEIQNANNQGQLAVWREAQKEGLLNSEETFKVWATDRSPCPSCKAMSGKKVKLNEKWTLPDGRSVDVPSENHPHCFCFQTLEL